VAGYFKSLLDRPLTGPQVLRPPRQLFAPRTTHEVEGDEAQDEDSGSADATMPSPGRAAPVWSDDGNSARFDGDTVGGSRPVSVLPDLSDGVGGAVDPNAQRNARPSPLVPLPGRSAPQSSPGRNGHPRVDRHVVAEPTVGPNEPVEHVATPDRDSSHAPAPADRSIPLRARNDVLRGRIESSDFEESRPSPGHASQPHLSDAPHARRPRQEAVEEPVSVEIGRVDVIVGQPEAPQPGLRPPLAPLSRGLGWAAGPPASLR
jgi:hypothetical protein